MKQPTLAIATIVLGVLILLGILGRVLPHPPNATPMAAIALFAGFYFGRSIWALAAPLLVLLFSDVFVLGTYDVRIMAVVYASFLFPLLLYRYVRRRPSPIRIGAAAVAASGVFFLSSNLAVWLFSGMYTPDVSGLVLCFAAAVPFFKWLLAGDLVYSAALFAGYFALRRVRLIAPAPAERALALG